MKLNSILPLALMLVVQGLLVSCQEESSFGAKSIAAEASRGPSDDGQLDPTPQGEGDDIETTANPTPINIPTDPVEPPVILFPKPVTPKDLVATGGTTTLDISWVNPDAIANSGFYLAIDKASSAARCENGVDVGNVVAYRATGLQPYTEYIVAVCAYNIQRDFSLPAVALGKTRALEPVEVKNFLAMAKSQESIELSWEAPAQSSGLFLTWQEGESAPEDCKDGLELAAQTKGLLVEQLMSSTLHSFRICNSNVEGVHSKGVIAADTTHGIQHDIHPIEVPICSALGEGDQGGSGAGLNYGLQGQLYDSGAKFSNFEQLVANAHANDGVIENPIYMDKLDIPTRVYDTGFVKGHDQNGSPILVQNTKGQPLIEYFGVSFQGRMTLSKDEAGNLLEDEGFYEVAVLSDDGTIVTMQNEHGEDEVIVDNNRTTATRFSCGKKLVKFTKNSKHPFTLNYFQAPKYHIALVAMMKKWSDIGADGKPTIAYDQSADKDLECGKSGNEYWFLPNQSSAPTGKYLGLLDRGWKVLSATNFLLPKEDDVNLCADPTYVPPLRDNCFEEKISYMVEDSVQLKNGDIDVATLEVQLFNQPGVSGQDYSFDEQSSVLSVLSADSNLYKKLDIRYCLK